MPLYVNGALITFRERTEVNIIRDGKLSVALCDSPEEVDEFIGRVTGEKIVDDTEDATDE